MPWVAKISRSSLWSRLTLGGEGGRGGEAKHLKDKQGAEQNNGRPVKYSQCLLSVRACRGLTGEPLGPGGPLVPASP